MALNAIVVLITIVCLFLMVIILIQNPKGGGVDSAFGGSAANSMFGAAQSTDIIVKITWYLAGALIVLCVVASFFVRTAGSNEIQLLTQ
jgi:preprotein translocase subunit SecG